MGVGVGEGEFGGDAYQAETAARSGLHALNEGECDKAVAAEGHGAGTGPGYSGEGGPASIQVAGKVQRREGEVSEVEKG